MAFSAERLSGLIKAKRLELQEFAAEAGFNYGTLRTWVRGNNSPGRDKLFRLAHALNVRPEYLGGEGPAYGDDITRAAIEMAFEVLEQEENITVGRKERCRRAKPHDGAPRTLTEWRALSDMLDLAVGTPRSTSRRIS